MSRQPVKSIQGKDLNVLIIEDSESDAALDILSLKKAGYNVMSEQAETPDQMEAALADKTFDVILADHNLPQFDAYKALSILKESGLDIPFIVVSGEIDEEIATNLMVSGAHDYIMKSNLRRLVPAIEREIREATIRRERMQAADELHSMISRQEALLAAIPDIVTEVDENKVYTWANQAAMEFFGDDMIGKEAAFYFLGEQETYITVQPLFAGDENVIYLESWQRRKDGARRLLAWWCRVLKDGRGNVKGALSSAQDITEHRESELLLREWQGKYQTLVENASEGITVTQNGVRVFANKKFADMLGYPVEELVGKPFSDIVYQGDREEAVQRQRRRLQGETIKSVQTRMVDKAGNIKWMEISGGPILWEGKPATFSIATDITERKQSEANLKELQQKYQTVAENAAEGITVSRDGIRLYANKRFADMLGYSVDEIINKPISDSVFPDDREIARQRQQRRVNGEVISSAELRVLDKSGNIKWFEFTGGPIMWEGKIAALSFSSDITARKQAETDIREWQGKYQSLVENAIEGISVTQDGVRKFVNKRFAEMLGYTVEELTGQPIIIVIHPDDRQSVINRYERRIKGEKILATQVRVVTKKGETKIFEFSGGPIRWEGRPAALAVANDITERMEMEEALRQSEQRYRRLFEDSMDAIIIVSRDGRFLDTNKAAENMYGRTREELLAWPVIESFADPANRARFQEQIERDGAVVNYEQRLLKKDGSIFNALLTSTVWRNSDGTIGGYTTILRDVTEQKKVEDDRQKSYAKLRETLNATVESIAAISEIRDPYTAGHQRNVAKLAGAIAEQMGLPAEKIAGIKVAGLLHDVGKMSVPAQILSKPGQLTQIEFNLIKTHPKVGWDILKAIDFPWPIAQIVLQHHRRMDDSGYPECERGNEILIEARILGVADVVEAMASHRPYRHALGIDVALEEISKNRGKLYDPDVVDACLILFKEKGFKFD